MMTRTMEAINTGEIMIGNPVGTTRKTETKVGSGTTRDMGSLMRERPHMGLMGRAMMFSRGGARFQFSKGDAHIDIRCPQNETLQNCVDAASRLIDKVHSLEPGSSEQGAAH